MTIGTLLVANRGEVAVRVLRAARQLGLRGVAVYSDADREAPHLAQADQAVRIGPPPAAESYLCIEAILRAADKTGADAIHPGYGFLSESAAFAGACEAAGLTFVGPQPEVIELMSRKVLARQVAHEAGAPVVPAVEGSDPATIVRRVRDEIGFPALVKAVAGGGGKGMRVATGPEELEAALATAGREALAAFGDAALFVERYLPSGRHLEVQVVGDGNGQVLHIFDRDCSVQRRHQKVVEEAPASVNSAVARKRAIEAALRIAARVSYRSLGTVEFLALGADVYFLEMNTRLQVEHPVTEAVTGVDVVELQLRLAGGEPLSLSQSDISVQGHALEVRVYAEDARHGFLPQAGRPGRVHWPGTVRVDAALEAGQEVGTYYDPMLAKLVAHGASRELARQKMVDAIDATVILGLTTNLGFLRQLVASDQFARAEVHTSWLDEHLDELEADDDRVPLVAAALYMAENPQQGQERDPFGADGWRAGGPTAATRLTLAKDGERHEVVVARPAPAGAGDPGNRPTRVEVDGAAVPFEVGAPRMEGDDLVVELDGQLERFAILHEQSAVLVAYHGGAHRFELGHTYRRDHDRADGVVVAPLPGILVAVNVAPGDAVHPGNMLGVLESMKMEYPLKATLPAIVARVAFDPGAQVTRGDVLFELVPVAVDHGTSAVSGPGDGDLSEVPAQSEEKP